MQPPEVVPGGFLLLIRSRWSWGKWNQKQETTPNIEAQMPISDFPAQLQPIIQQGFLRRRFEKSLTSKLGYRKVADRQIFPGRIGQSIKDTRRGLKVPVTTPTAANTNTNLDNGMTASSFSVEQYELGIDMYNDTTDLNMVNAGIAIASVFVENAEVNGIQAHQSLDRIARNTLYFGNQSPTIQDVGGYMGGNTRVSTALTAPASTLHVDDARGFVNIVGSLGSVVPVNPGNPLTVSVNGNPYTLVGVTLDSPSGSTAPSGKSGTLTFSGNVATADGALNAPVVAATAPVVVRPVGRKTTADILATDTLTMTMVLNAVATLRRNAVPTIDGLYNCYLDDEQLLGLFSASDFRELFRGAYNSTEFRQGEVFQLLGVRFIPTTEAPQQTLNGVAIHRAIVVGKGALIEGDYAEVGYSDLPDEKRSLKEIVDAVCMVTREPLDRLGQIIAQSWYWIGGFALPTDTTANTLVIPTASNSALKRGVVVESA
jgi:hypothetical protein